MAILTRSKLISKNFVFVSSLKNLSKTKYLSAAEKQWVKAKVDLGESFIEVPRLDGKVFAIFSSDKWNNEEQEKLRAIGAQLCGQINANKSDSISIVADDGKERELLAVAEGTALANYQFLKYLTHSSKKKNALQKIELVCQSLNDSTVANYNHLINAVYFSRDLVNEPSMFLTATEFGKQIAKAGKKVGYQTTVLNKKQIEKEKMGGLLAVNKGSVEPPTFIVTEYKHPNYKGEPIVLVGKGVVFDTGGLSLKPTPGSMDEMKCDMAGGAAVAGAIFALAASQVQTHVVGLIPATDNRPGMEALAPQDIITISDGTTVEVLNTDAEGRLILADALVFAKKWKPKLVIDLATLTGAAVRAIGSYATAMMGTADGETMSRLEESGFNTWERLVRFPMWSDYGDEMKSDIADLKNLGGPNAGQITAAKFLEHFTSYPWIHLDIAGPAYISGNNAYRTKGGTGVGVRLLFDFISNWNTEQKKK